MFVQPLTTADSLTCFELFVCFYFRTEAVAYEMYENKMHTKYFVFTALGIEVCCAWRILIDKKKLQIVELKSSSD